MITRTLRNGCAAAFGAGLLAVGCGGSPTAPTPTPQLTIAGAWLGTVLLPNAYTAQLSLQQSGASVSGTMRVYGVMPETPVAGTVSAGSRTLSWRVNDDCEVWTGDLDVDGSGTHMQGALRVDRKGCKPAQSDDAGTLSLDKR
jgi:hypothetical protein